MTDAARRRDEGDGPRPRWAGPEGAAHAFGLGLITRAELAAQLLLIDVEPLDERGEASIADTP